MKNASLKGRLIVFEGLDGSGKTTQINLLEQWIRTTYPEIPVLKTSEPGGSELGQKIRQILLDQEVLKAGHIDPMAELLLFSADRAQHVSQVIRPFLEKGGIVLCDRYIASMVAYQGWGRGLDLDTIDRLNSISTQELFPDLVFYLTTSIQVCQERLKKDRMPIDGGFLERVNESYLRQFCRNCFWTAVDGNQPIEYAHYHITLKLSRYLKDWGLTS